MAVNRGLFPATDWSAIGSFGTSGRVGLTPGHGGQGGAAAGTDGRPRAASGYLFGFSCVVVLGW